MSSHHGKLMSFCNTDPQSFDPWYLSGLIYKCSNLLRWYQWFLSDMCQDLVSYLFLYLSNSTALFRHHNLNLGNLCFCTVITDLPISPSCNITFPRPQIWLSFFFFHYEHWTFSLLSSEHMLPCLIWTEYLLPKPMYQYPFVLPSNLTTMLCPYLYSALPSLWSHTQKDHAH